MSEDIEIIKRRMLLELQRRALQQSAPKQEKKIDFLTVFTSSLTDDGREMFNRAVKQYGEAAKKVGERLGALIHAGRIRGKLNAETVYWVFYEIGMPIRLETRIVYKKGGEVKSISEMLREED
ncbi:MAG: hypothetical protein QXT33_03225 [Thermofilum sp.]